MAIKTKKVLSLVIKMFTCDQDVPENPEMRHKGVTTGLDSLSAWKLEFMLGFTHCMNS